MLKFLSGIGFSLLIKKVEPESLGI
jgi:hypothetical protein